MAKGKHQASQTAKRLRAAEERIRELEDLRTREEQEAHERELKLKAEIHRLKGRFVTEVDREVERRTQAFHELHASRIRDLKVDYRNRLREALTFVVENGRFELKMEGYPKFASILGLQLGEIIDWTTKDNNRTSRRANKAHANLIDQATRMGEL